MTKRSPKTASLRHERHYNELGVRFIFGVDEVGRGAWAGPVAVGTVCLPLGDLKYLSRTLVGVRDSKDMTPRQREALVDKVKQVCVVWAIGSASSSEIDQHGINGATKLAMARALDHALGEADFDEPDALFLDSLLWPEMRHIPQVSIVDGDKRSLSIAAASVLAKTWRDDIMRELDAKYPQYGFSSHKGYGTTSHRQALKDYGPSPVHRNYYKPVKKAFPPASDQT